VPGSEKPSTQRHLATGLQDSINFRLIGHIQRIIHFNAEVARGTLDRRTNSAQRSRSSRQLKQTALNEVIPVRATQFRVLHAPNKGLTRCCGLIQDAASLKGCGQCKRVGLAVD